MSKVNNQESFDGIPVTLYDGKFSGGFDLPEQVGEAVRMDDVVSFVVTGAVSKVGMGTTKQGDLKRTNTFEVLNVLPIDADVAKAFFDAGGAISPKETAEVLAQPATSHPQIEEEPTLFEFAPLGLDDDDDDLEVYGFQS